MLEPTVQVSLRAFGPAGRGSFRPKASEIFLGSYLDGVFRGTERNRT
jgi:hypothetical protein